MLQSTAGIAPGSLTQSKMKTTKMWCLAECCYGGSHLTIIMVKLREKLLFLRINLFLDQSSWPKKMTSLFFGHHQVSKWKIRKLLSTPYKIACSEY
jgi:hypothetical protein